MSAASGARFLRAMVAPSSAMDAGPRPASSSIGRRDTASELIGNSAARCSKRDCKCRHARGLLGADLEIDRACKRVGGRRPLLDVGHERVDLALRDALALHVDLDPHVGDADQFFAALAGPPPRGEFEVALELKL